tara:strand:+ start:771 stop:926 length:156 start_codon:yes stop_codon:yes gene_type:complete
MKGILKLIAVAVFLYFGINWLADNPKTVRKARKHMNKSVKHGKKAISKAAN